ncbi:uncharacterized protein LOC134238814 [Saccostrea cucullata]|uniref:uncharacterized protein LOC134238814 n=1 Tax=Saccostrea cuccullata TaxID=36930 RepID=UPI002ED0A935
MKSPENNNHEVVLYQQQMTEDREKQTQPLSVIKVREFNVPDLLGILHITSYPSDRLWISDKYGNLVQTDLLGNVIQKIKTSGGSDGHHTVTQNGDLIFTDIVNKVINRIPVTQDNTINEFIKPGVWVPLSIHSSHINGDLLVGMTGYREARVTRYNKTGKEIENIQRDNRRRKLYTKPHYITENINGDICTTDYTKGVVVVNKSGQHRFSWSEIKVPFLWNLY